MNSKLLTHSPCVGICSTTFGDDICYGCHRTYLEVIQWNTLNDTEKDSINQRLIKKRVIPDVNTNTTNQAD